MFAHERHQRICQLLERKKRIAFANLQDVLGVSPATLRRDLALLEQGRRIIRVHGGVLHPQQGRAEPSFDRKSRQGAGTKRRMAAEAVRLIEDDSTVIVDSGTTCLEAGRLLLERPKVRLITNSVPLLYEGWQAGASIIALGGELRNLTGALRGSGAVKGFEVLHADWAILGASGVSATHGISTTEMGEASVKQAMIRAAGRRILLADGRKWDAPSNVRFADWEDFDFWITSNDLAKTLLHFAPGSRLKIIRS